MSDKATQGRTLDEEANLGKDIYFAKKYFERTQLFSQAAQLNVIHAFGAQRILEIGPGNGFVASFLRCAGLHVDTLDVNADLSPTHVGSLLDLDQLFEPKSYDLVVCCEVLEHLPFETFEPILDQMAGIAKKNVLITLPQNKKPYFGLSGLLRIPGRGQRWFNFSPAFGRKNKIYENHHWELGWKKEHEIPAIAKLMASRFKVLSVKPEPMNPYHVFFRLAVHKDADV